MRCSLVEKSVLETTSLFILISPLFVAKTTIGWSFSAGSGGWLFSTLLGKFSQNCLARSGAITMKMIRSTSTTSTSGVTFMLGCACPGFFPRCPRSIPMACSPLESWPNTGQLACHPGRSGNGRGALALIHAQRDPRETDLLAYLEHLADIGIAGRPVSAQDQSPLWLALVGFAQRGEKARFIHAVAFEVRGPVEGKRKHERVRFALGLGIHVDDAR